MRLFSPHKGAAPEDAALNPDIVEIITKVIKMSAENVRPPPSSPPPRSDAA